VQISQNSEKYLDKFWSCAQNFDFRNAISDDRLNLKKGVVFFKKNGVIMIFPVLGATAAARLDRIFYARQHQNQLKGLSFVCYVLLSDNNLAYWEVRKSMCCWKISNLFPSFRKEVNVKTFYLLQANSEVKQTKSRT